MTSGEVLTYLRAAGKPVYFSQIANYFPGELEEAELWRKLEWMVRRKLLRRLENWKYEIVEGGDLRDKKGKGDAGT